MSSLVKSFERYVYFSEEVRLVLSLSDGGLWQRAKNMENRVTAYYGRKI